MDERDPIEQMLDAVLFGPVGLLLELRERFPDLAEKGRQHLRTQVTVARMVGKFAVQIGSRKVAEYVARQRPAGPPEEAPVAVDDTATPAAGGSAAKPHVSASASATLDTVALPIPGYDTLAASQVVARLDGLDDDELEAVRVYESSHRNRKTVLGKVAQLQRVA